MGLDLDSYGLAQHPDRPQIPGPVQDVAGVFAPILAETPDAVALVDSRGRYTFAQLEVRVEAAARALHGLGVTPGQRVAACTPNHAELIVAFLASQRLGAIWVGINQPLAPPEKRYLLEDAEVALFLGSLEMVAQVKGIAAQMRTLCVAPGQTGDEWEDALAGAPPTRPAYQVDPFAPAAIAYTSGTTGFPKGAVHSQHNLVLLGAVARAEGYYPPEMPHGVMLPLTTLNLMALVPLHTLQNGACCVVIDRGKPVELAGWVERERIGHFTAVPAIYHDLLSHPEVRVDSLRSLRQPEMGGANIPPAIRALYRRRLDRDICVGYGMTEAPTTVTRTQPSARFEAGLCGHPLPQYRLDIVDEDGASLAVGEVGEVVISAARSGHFAGVYTPMLGYWKRPDATRAALRGGRYHSGDLGRLDAQGQLFIMGRSKELIIRGGANVYPAEVERVLHACKGVAAAAVVGKECTRLGERVVAFVQCDAGQVFDPEALRHACEQALARYKVPEEFHPVRSMPRNAMGKIVKDRLLPVQT